MKTEDIIHMLKRTDKTEGKLERGELKNIEFKEALPAHPEKYTKTIVAFANTQGGKLIIGVEDETWQVVGVDDSVLFQTMDSIANAVSDSCEPQIMPEIEPYTVDGKTVIVVTVSPGMNRPYYLKAKGKDAGTYIRVGATTRLAYPDRIRDLEMEGRRISWDELTCVGYKVTEKAVKKLCRDMNTYRRGLQDRKHLASKLPIVTRTNLEDWNVLKKTEDGYLASNAFVLLTSDYFSFSKTQCAVFKGTERSVFLDKRDYSGPVYEQIEEAVNFVLRNIRLGAKIEGLIRKEDYELPVDAIREMIVNAHCHRNLTEASCVQVAVYDDRLEVTSPGGLYNGLTYEELMQGHSKLRNRTLANVFNQMGLIEAWGTGIRRIMEEARAYNLPKPQFIEMPEMFRVNLYRKPLLPKERETIGETSVEHRWNIGEDSEKCRRSVGEVSEKRRKNVGEELTETQRKIIKYLAETPSLSARVLSEKIGISTRRAESNIKRLKELNYLIRHGSPKNGYWEVVK